MECCERKSCVHVWNDQRCIAGNKPDLDTRKLAFGTGLVMLVGFGLFIYSLEKFFHGFLSNF